MTVNTFSINILAQAEAPAANPLGMMIPMVLMVAAMWFLIIAPQRKKQKKHQQMLTELKTGDEVVTSGGIYGTIMSVKDDRFSIRIAEGTKVDVLKSAVIERAVK